MGKNPERITNIKSLINKCKWEGIYFPPEKDDWKKIETILLNLLYAKEEKDILLIFQNVTQIVKN